MDFDLMRQRLVQAREHIGYNRKQFAEAMKIPYRTITNYENGAREPGSDYLTKVADFCGCTTDWLLGLTDTMNQHPDSESQSECEPEGNLLKIAGRDGSFVERRLTDKELQALISFVDLLPDASDDL